MTQQLQLHNDGEDRDRDQRKHRGEKHALCCKGGFALILLTENGCHSTYRHCKSDDEDFFQHGKVSCPQLDRQKGKDRDDQQLDKADGVYLKISGDFLELQSADLEADAEHGQRSCSISDHFDGSSDEIRKLDVQEEEDQTDDDTDQSRVDELPESHLQIGAGRQLDQQDADCEDEDIVDQFHDGGIKYRICSVQCLDDRDADEAGVSEEQHEDGQILFRFRQLDQFGDREADGEDDRQDQQADNQYISTVL